MLLRLPRRYGPIGGLLDWLVMRRTLRANLDRVLGALVAEAERGSRTE